MVAFSKLTISSKNFPTSSLQKLLFGAVSLYYLIKLFELFKAHGYKADAFRSLFFTRIKKTTTLELSSPLCVDIAPIIPPREFQDHEVIEFIRSQPGEKHLLGSLKATMRMISPINVKFSNYIRGISGLVVEDGYVVYRPELHSSSQNSSTIEVTEEKPSLPHGREFRRYSDEEVIKFIRSHPGERYLLSSLKHTMRMISPNNMKFSLYIKGIRGLHIEDEYVIYRPDRGFSGEPGAIKMDGSEEYVRPFQPKKYNIAEIIDFINKQPGGSTTISRVKSMLNVNHDGFPKFKDYIRSFSQLEIYDEHTSSIRVRVRKKRWSKKIPNNLSHSDIVDIVLKQENYEMNLKDFCLAVGVNIYFPILIAELEKIDVLQVWEKSSGFHIVRYAPQKAISKIISNQPGRECVLSLIEVKRPPGIKLRTWMESMPEFEVFQKGLVHWVRFRKSMSTGSSNLGDIAATSLMLRNSEGAPTYAMISQRGKRLGRGRGVRGRGLLKSRGRGIAPPKHAKPSGEPDHNRFGLLQSATSSVDDS